MKKIELLAPAKNCEFGKAAIKYGADAVYIGVNSFSARSAAGNSVPEIAELVKFAHKYYAKVYAALNTILYNDELDAVKELINQLYTIGVDALIIQDMSILEMDLPPIALHASTQTNNYELEHIKFLDKVGFERIILARELSLEQIKKIKSQTRTELEVFVHGALCVSLSGQCYLSCAISDRSANRGECAQPCRMRYSLIDSNDKIILNESYLLSLKDLNQSNSLESLIRAGVSSLKIEGRLKDIDYVKNVTAYYRKKLDILIAKNKSLNRASSGQNNFFFEPDPSKSFNREFTDYFLYKRRKDIVSPNTPKSLGEYIGKVTRVSNSFFEIEHKSIDLSLANGDGVCFLNKNSELTGININRVEDNKIFVKETKNLYKGVDIYRNYNHEFNKLLKQNPFKRKIDLKIKVSDIVNGIKINCCDEDNNSCEIEFEISKELAKNNHIALENIRKQFTKTGDSIFKISKIDIELSQVCFIPVKMLNHIRRSFLEKIEELRLKNYIKPPKTTLNHKVKYPTENLSFKANISNNLAEKFYHNHGVKQIDKAFELSKVNDSNALMTTKYCLKYQAGLCPQYSNYQNHNFEEPFYLKDIKGNRYKLEFNCDECFMKIF